jgi:hypothetical protein
LPLANASATSFAFFAFFGVGDGGTFDDGDAFDEDDGDAFDDDDGDAFDGDAFDDDDGDAFDDDAAGPRCGTVGGPFDARTGAAGGAGVVVGARVAGPVRS